MSDVQTTESRASKRIFIVDDHPVFRLGLRDLIGNEPDLEFVGDAEDVNTAMERLENAEVDLVVVDISLKDASGLELLKRLKARFPDLRTLTISMHDETLFAERALRSGAVGYLMKDTPAPELVDGLRRALRGELVVSKRLSDTLMRRAIAGKPTTPASPIEVLSDREIEVFELLGRGLRTREVAEKLGISVKTVETHQAHIKKKLGHRNSNELLRAAVSWVAGLE